MPVTALSKSAVCPCYLRDDPKHKVITCCSDPDGKHYKTVFQSKRQFKLNGSCYCRSEFNGCPMYRFIQEHN